MPAAAILLAFAYRSLSMMMMHLLPAVLPATNRLFRGGATISASLITFTSFRDYAGLPAARPADADFDCISPALILMGRRSPLTDALRLRAAFEPPPLSGAPSRLPLLI